jgi:hypothetical protein
MQATTDLASFFLVHKIEEASLMRSRLPKCLLGRFLDLEFYQLSKVASHHGEARK